MLKMQLKNSTYTIQKESDYIAKQAIYSNSLNGKTVTAPFFSLYIRNAQYVKTLLNYISTVGYSYNIKGLIFPIDRNHLIQTIPSNLKDTSIILNDPLPEVFYLGSLKKAIYDRYAKINGLPNAIIQILKNPNKTRNWTIKEDEYAEALDTIFLEDTNRVKLTNAIINLQLEGDVDIVIPFAPIILNDSVSLIATKQFYEQAQKLYLGNVIDIDETLGKRIALPLFIHESVLSNDKKIEEIIKLISNEEHSAIALKIYFSNQDTVKDLDFDRILNLSKLFKAIGFYSKLKKIPIYLLGDSSLGLIALLYGFDSYSEPFSSRQIEIEGNVDINKLKIRNPTVDYGGIYDIIMRKKVLHKNYIPNIKFNNLVLPCPASKYCNTYIKGSDVVQMKRNAFWEHARMHLLESANYQIDEVLKSIEEKTIRPFKSRFNNFFNQAILPE